MLKYRKDTENKKKGEIQVNIRFDETVRGRKFYEADVPKLIRAICENTEELKRANDLKELELKHKGILEHKEK